MVLNNKKRITNFTVHFIMLGILFFLPEALYSINHPKNIMPYIHPLPYIFIFYINYLWFNNRFLFTSKKPNINRIIYAGINILLILFLSGLLYAAHEYLMSGHPHPAHVIADIGLPYPSESPFIIISKFAVRDVVVMILTIALSATMNMISKIRSVEIMENRIEAERNKLELAHLKNQLNPHFLFNTLNNIYALTAISPAEAQKAIHELSNMLRYVLYETNVGKVPLNKDLMFIEAYIELMKMRISSNVKLDININHHDTEGRQIAPMLFVTIIENAFKHGISAIKESFININLYVENDTVICKVSNSNIPKNETDKSGRGIGLANLRRQLNIIYPNEHSLTINKENNTFNVLLIVNINNSIA